MSNVQVVTGDLFESNAQTLTNTINTVGVMGKGISLEFKRRFGEMFVDYVERCEQSQVRLGEPYLFKPLFPPWVLNFPTKDHWRSRSSLDVIRRGLDWVAEHYESWEIESLAVPPLGCGEGGLEWRIVGPTLFQGLSVLNIPVMLYAPFETPHEELQPTFLEEVADLTRPTSRIPASAVALAVIVETITSWHHAYPIGRVSFQKLAYFATTAGIPTGLEFERRSFGPFSQDLKRLQTRMMHNGLIEEEKRGNAYLTTPGPTLRHARRAFADDLHEWEVQIEQVADLFLRLPSSRFVEIAATIHDVQVSLSYRNRARGQRTVAESDLIGEINKWKARRSPPLQEHEIISVIDTLNYLGWIDIDSDDSELQTV